MEGWQLKVLDEKAYREWLEPYPIDICAALAIRAALRVFPLTRHQTIRAVGQDIDLWLRAARAILTTSASAIYGETKYVSATKFAFSSVAIDTAELADRPVFSSNIAATASWVYAQDDYVDSDLTHVARQAAVNANNDAFSAISAQNLSYAASIWNELNRDIDAIENGASAAELLSSRLWVVWNPIHEQWIQMQNWIRKTHNKSEFWIDWYQRLLDGRPQNWEMLEEIALIDPEDWDKGAEHVNGLIAEIQARYAVKESAETAQKVLAEFPVASAQMGHNNPPEDIEEDPFTAEDAAFVQKMLDDIAEESESSEPDVSRLGVAADGLRRIVLKIGVWLAGVAKVSVTTFFATLGTSLALKIDDPLFAYLIRQLETLQPVIEAIEKWLPFVGG